MNTQATLEPETQDGVFDLPWPVIPLGEVIRQRKEFIVIDDATTYKRPRVQVRAQGLLLRDEVLGSTIRTKRQQLCKTNDFLVAEIDAKVGGFGLVPVELEGAIVSSHYYLFEVDTSQLDPEFLDYAVKMPGFLAQIEARGSTNYASIRAAQVLTYTIPFPPLPEQHAIATSLRAARASRDAAANVLEQTRELKRSLLRHLFTYGPVSVQEAGNVELQETDYGNVRADWIITPLSNLANVKPGITLGKKFKAEDNLVEVRYLRVANVQDGYFDLSQIKTTYIKDSEVSKYMLRNGDVLMTEGGDEDKLGRGFIWREEIKDCSFQNHIFSVRTNTSELDSEFFSFQIQSDYGKAYFLSVAHRTTNLASINSTKLKAYPVIKPTLDEQLTMKAQLWGAENKLVSARRDLEDVKKLLLFMLHDLLTGRIRVPLPTTLQEDSA